MRSRAGAVVIVARPSCAGWISEDLRYAGVGTVPGGDDDAHGCPPPRPVSRKRTDRRRRGTRSHRGPCEDVADSAAPATVSRPWNLHRKRTARSTGMRNSPETPWITATRFTARRWSGSGRTSGVPTAGPPAVRCPGGTRHVGSGAHEDALPTTVEVVEPHAALQGETPGGPDLPQSTVRPVGEGLGHAARSVRAAAVHDDHTVGQPGPRGGGVRTPAEAVDSVPGADHELVPQGGPRAGMASFVAEFAGEPTREAGCHATDRMSGLSG